MTQEELRTSYKELSFREYKLCRLFFHDRNNLQEDNWKLQKELVHNGVNPSEVLTAIRNNDVEKLQEITSREKFNFNQIIEPSIYERCSFITDDKHLPTLGDYAAFFGSINCFKFLQMNDPNFTCNGKYAVAGGNLEIFRFCRQNNSSFSGSLNAAIEFHQNDIFTFLYENRLENLTNLVSECITYDNYEILSFLEKKNVKIPNYIINESANIGNIFLLKHFHLKYKLPNEILIFALKSGNIDVVNYVLEQKNVDLNAKEINSICLKFVL